MSVFYNGKLFLKRLCQGIVEIIVFLPVILALAIYFIPSSLHFVWFLSLPLFFIVGIVFGVILRGKRKWIHTILFVFLSFFYAFEIIDSTIGAIIVSLVVGYLFLYRGLLFVENTWANVFPVTFFWAGLLIYFFSYFFYLNNEALSPYLSVITWAGVLSIVITLFVTNSRHLADATLSGEDNPHVNRTLKWQNRFFLIITIVVVFFIVNFNLIQGAFYSIVGTILYWVSWFFNLFNSEDPPVDGSVTPDFSMEMGEESETSVLGEMIGQIFMVIGYIAVIVFGFIFLYFLMKKLWFVFMHISNWIIKFLNGMVGGLNNIQEKSHYVDEKESVINWEEWRKNSGERVRNWLSSFKGGPRWEELNNNRDKIRFLYRHFMFQRVKEGFEMRSSRTPLENIDKIKEKYDINAEESDLDQLGEAYIKARYSEKEMSDEEVKKTKGLFE